MLGRVEIRKYAQVCARIGNEVAEPDGFVPVRNLLVRFKAQLIVRPLLVEAMLSTVRDQTGHQSWAVLVDSEKYPVADQDINEECSAHPLNQRLRNTIAHELVHSLAFRASEFGVTLSAAVSSIPNREALIAAIERETEKLSPLLLWSETALRRLVAERSEPFDVDALRAERLRLGLSRQVFINRLQLLGLGEDKGPSYYRALRDIGIGIGEWRDDGKAIFRNWPLFINFDRNIVPWIFQKISGADRVPADSVFEDRQFRLCGGTSGFTVFESAAGTSAHPKAERVRLHCAIERAQQRPGSSFMYVVRKVGGA